MPPLRRRLRPLTLALTGLGIAIGSGIFRTPSLIAEQLGAAGPMLWIWALGGAITLAQSLVTAELATRFPRAGGEYVFLREAYGDFAAFFFGVAYTVFIVGGGAATVAVAFGEAAQALFGLSESAVPWAAAAVLVSVTLLNGLGLSAGARLTEALTVLKIGAIVAVALAALFGPASAAPLVTHAAIEPAYFPALLAVLWSYEGSTDSVKLAEEAAEPERQIPRVLIGSAFFITLFYLLVNVAYLNRLSIEEMAGSTFVGSTLAVRLFGAIGERLLLALMMVVFAGALSSTLLATVRVLFALARDGLFWPQLARMNARQAPAPALAGVLLVALVFLVGRRFREILDIYFLAAALLFGLSYGSLLVFRRRDRGVFPAGVFRCPFGPGLAAGLIALQIAIAADIFRRSPGDAAGTGGLLLVCAGGYVAWRRFGPGRAA